jgi:hypothetical protein
VTDQVLNPFKTKQNYSFVYLNFYVKSRNTKDSKLNGSKHRNIRIEYAQYLNVNVILIQCFDTAVVKYFSAPTFSEDFLPALIIINLRTAQGGLKFSNFQKTSLMQYCEV